MSTPRLRARVPSASAVTVARLDKHILKFHKKGKDQSGKCDVAYTNNETDVVFGVVFEIAESEKPVLDKHEGLKIGYEEKSVAVFTEDGKELEAFSYYATNIDPSLNPYAWYREHVIRGAHEHGLPAEYTSIISAVASMPDLDQIRHEKELSIYL